MKPQPPKGPFKILIIGNIGAGKSTIMKALHKICGGAPFHQTFSEHHLSLLHDYYANPKTSAMLVQTQFRFMYERMWHDALEAYGDGQTVYVESMIDTHQTFGQICFEDGRLETWEHNILGCLYEYAKLPTAQDFDLIVHLKTTDLRVNVNRILQRQAVQSLSDPPEGIPLRYLERIDSLHEKLLHGLPNVLTIYTDVTPVNETIGWILGWLGVPFTRYQQLYTGLRRFRFDWTFINVDGPPGSGKSVFMDLLGELRFSLYLQPVREGTELRKMLTEMYTGNWKLAFPVEREFARICLEQWLDACQNPGLATFEAFLGSIYAFPRAYCQLGYLTSEERDIIFDDYIKNGLVSGVAFGVNPKPNTMPLQFDYSVLLICQMEEQKARIKKRGHGGESWMTDRHLEEVNKAHLDIPQQSICIDTTKLTPLEVMERFLEYIWDRDTAEVDPVDPVIIKVIGK